VLQAKQKRKKVTTTQFPRRLIKEKAEVRQSQGSVPPSLTVAMQQQQHSSAEVCTRDAIEASASTSTQLVVCQPMANCVHTCNVSLPKPATPVSAHPCVLHQHSHMLVIMCIPDRHTGAAGDVVRHTVCSIIGMPYSPNRYHMFCTVAGFLDQRRGNSSSSVDGRWWPNAKLQIISKQCLGTVVTSSSLYQHSTAAQALELQAASRRRCVCGPWHSFPVSSHVMASSHNAQFLWPQPKSGAQLGCTG
jgi:hypothetical protein